MKFDYKLSIVIVCYNNHLLTSECIRSIKSFSPSFPYEIICIDNASDKKTEVHIIKEFPDVCFLRMDYNAGFSKASNIGIMKSRGEYILLLNNDTIITGSIFDRSIDFMSKNPTISAIGPRHLDGKKNFQLSYGEFPSFFTEVNVKIMKHKILRNDSIVMQYLEDFCSRERKVDWVSGSCLFLRRDALRQVGLLDERMFLYLEDVDICRRLNNKGWGVYYFPEVSIMHYRGRTAKDHVFRCAIEFRKSQLIFARKYYGRIGEIIMRSFLFFKFLIIGFLNIIKLGYYKILKKDIQHIRLQVLICCKIIPIVSLSKVDCRPIEPALTI